LAWINFSATSCTSVLSVTLCLFHGKLICLGDNFFDFPPFNIDGKKLLPQKFLFSGFACGRYFWGVGVFRAIAFLTSHA
jgi:hypothetical protein